MRVALTCGCGASVEAQWASTGYSRREPEPKHLADFRRDHKRCRDLAASGGLSEPAGRPSPGSDGAPTPDDGGRE